jgi:VIT1/CCC1 family predicted Fe2+/Mn2+ transporter
MQWDRRAPRPEGIARTPSEVKDLARPGKDPANDNREAAVVDQLIRKLRPFDRSSSSSAFLSERPSSGGARPLTRIRPVRGPMRSGAVWSCVMLGVLLGAALPYWPYARACGWWLLLYMSAVGTVVIAGIWGARVSWRSRLAFPHIVAVCTIIWGLALLTHEVLPRVGYAKTRAAWRCHGIHPAANAIPVAHLR